MNTIPAGEAEEQLRQAQKMEAIGKLAGGIAHGFNNLLTVILCSAELLLAAPTLDDDLREDAEQIRQAAAWASALTRQLLAFSRQEALEPRRLDLNTVVGNLSQLLRLLIGEDIELVTWLAPDLGQVHADPGQLEQVIMNLAANARDVMLPGGTLKIATANVSVYDAHERAQIGVEQGCYILLTISDTSVGVDAATHARIGESCFTTKAPGKGTGLSLDTIHGIVSQSGGRIVVDGTPGQGTAFRIYLPRMDAAQQPISAADAL